MGWLRLSRTRIVTLEARNDAVPSTLAPIAP